MYNYKDQKLLKRMVKAYNGEPEDMQQAIIGDFKIEYRDASDKRARLTSLSSAWEVEQANQACYFYEDFFEMVGVKY